MWNSPFFVPTHHFRREQGFQTYEIQECFFLAELYVLFMVPASLIAWKDWPRKINAIDMKNFIIILAFPASLFGQVFSINIDEQKVIPNSAFMLGQFKYSIHTDAPTEVNAYYLYSGIEVRKSGTDAWHFIGDKGYNQSEPYTWTLNNGSSGFHETSLFPLACLKENDSIFDFSADVNLEIRILYEIDLGEENPRKIRSNIVSYLLPALNTEEMNALKFIRDSVYVKYDEIKWLTNIRYMEGGYIIMRELESFCQKFPNSALIPYIQLDLIVTRRNLRNPNKLDVNDRIIVHDLINYFENANLFTKKYNIDFLQSILNE